MNNSIDNNFHSGKRLALVRKLNGWTQENLLDQSEFPFVDLKTLKRWEKQGIPEKEIKGISDFSHLDLGLFINDDVTESLFKKEFCQNLATWEEREYTGLIQAIQENQLPRVKSFLEKTKNVNKTDKDEWSPLLWASYENRPEAASLLIQAGAELDRGDRIGLTPLICAAGKNYGEMAKLFLRHGANPNLKDEQGWTALRWAVSQNFAPTVKCLVEQSVNLDLPDYHGWTSLMAATRDGFAEIRKILFHAQANPNSQNELGETSLMIAVQSNDLAGVQLLKKRTELSLRNHDRKNAIDLARELEFEDILQELSF